MDDNNDQRQGISNPPDNGNVTSIDTPNSNDTTIAQAAAPNQPDQQKPAQPAPAQVSQTPQTPGQPTQPQDQTAQQSKQPDLSKPQGPTTPTTAPSPAQNPAVQKAGIFHDVAEALAGGPRYKYDVDAYGNTTRQKVPVSNTHLALAIAMEALGGAATGLANGQGPNGMGRAAAASMAQAKQNVQQQDQQARQQATEDFSRRAQVTETNMRMHATARNVGRQNQEDTDKYIAQYKPLVDQLMSGEYQGFSKGIVKYSDFGKYNVTMDNAIPYARVPRLVDGKQVEDSKGVPQWDIDYMIVDPKFKASFQPTDEDKKNYKEMYGTDIPDMLGSTPMQAVMWLNKKSQLAGWSTAHNNFRDFENTTNEARNSQGGATTNVDFTKSGALTAPAIKDSNIQDLADSAAAEVAPQVKTVMAPDNFNAFIRGIINQESGGNPNAVSPTGAIGLMQLTKAIAAQFGVTDRTNPEQNVKAGSQYFAQLLNQYKDPKLALAAYYSGPGSIQNGKIVDTQLHSAADTNNYAQKLMNSVGSQTTTETKPDEFKLPDMGQFSKENPTFPSAVEKLNASLAHTDGSYGAAFKDMESKGFSKDVSLIQHYLGSADTIKQHDDYVQTQAEIRKAQVQTDAQEQRAANKEAGKQASDSAAQDKKQAILNTLETADIPKDALNMDSKDLITNLKSQGVELTPEAIRDAQAIAQYKAPMNVASNKLWFKDSSLNQQDLLNIVTQLNPAFKEGNYANLNKFTNPNSPTMKTITASAGAVNHLNMLLDAAEEVKNRGNGSGQFPMLNRLAGEFGKSVGNADYLTLQGLTQAVNGELGKTLAGGFAPDKAQNESLDNIMKGSNSYQQVQDLAKLYTGLLHGKIAPIDEEYSQGSGGIRHIDMIPNSTSRLFQRMGMDTPWDSSYKPPVPGAIAGRDAHGNIVAWRTPNGQVIPVNQPATTQPSKTTDFLNSVK